MKNQKIRILVIVALALGLITIGAFGYGKFFAQPTATTAAPQPTATQPQPVSAAPQASQNNQPAATASQPQLVDNLDRPTTVDRFGQPITAVKFGSEMTEHKISLANSELGISLDIIYAWGTAGNDIYVRATNNGQVAIKDGSGIVVTYFNEKGKSTGFYDFLDLSYLKPGDTNKALWKISKSNRNPEYLANANWFIGWSITIKK